MQDPNLKECPEGQMHSSLPLLRTMQVPFVQGVRVQISGNE